MIKFNIPPCVGTEMEYIKRVIESRHISGDGVYSRKCSAWLEERFHAERVLLTTSGTTALDMAMVLCDLQKGDEVILPSYTFSSSATAPVMIGAKLVFVDIRPDTMNIDETRLEDAVSERTKAIIAVHYAGVACEMDTIMEIARRHGLMVIEDAAQAMMSTYKDRPLGTIGDFGCFSFHETKNYSMGEGGAIVINNRDYIERAEILWEKGTDRSRFLRGQVDKYTWVDKGDSYLPSELNAAYLWAQLEKADEIMQDRMRAWNRYYRGFEQLEADRKIERQQLHPDEFQHNGHMFFVKTKDIRERTALSAYLKEHGIEAFFHYVPLHTAPAGVKYGTFVGEDRYTTKESGRLLRLPMYYGITNEDIDQVIDAVYHFYQK